MSKLGALTTCKTVFVHSVSPFLIRADVLKYKLGQLRYLVSINSTTTNLHKSTCSIPCSRCLFWSQCFHATLPLSLPAFWVLSWGALGFYVMARHAQFLLGRTVKWTNRETGLYVRDKKFGDQPIGTLRLGTTRPCTGLPSGTFEFGLTGFPPPRCWVCLNRVSHTFETHHWLFHSTVQYWVCLHRVFNTFESVSTGFSTHLV
jgi:hypothetical protein